MDVTHCPELSPSSFLNVCINTNSSFIWATPLRGEATQHVITHLLACFAVMGTPSSLKTDNGPAYISRHFKQFLQSFSIKHITGIPAHLVPRQVNEKLEIGETNLTGKRVCLYFPSWIQRTHMASSSEDSTQGGPRPSKWRRDNKDPRRKKFQYGP